MSYSHSTGTQHRLKGQAKGARGSSRKEHWVPLAFMYCLFIFESESRGLAVWLLLACPLDHELLGKRTLDFMGSASSESSRRPGRDGCSESGEVGGWGWGRMTDYTPKTAGGL